MFPFTRLSPSSSADNQDTAPQGGDEFAQEARDLSHRLMPRKFERLEAMILVFSGAYGLLVTAVVLSGALWPLVVCALFVIAGLWRWRYPVRSAKQWMIDAMLCLVLLAALYIDPQTGAGTGPYLFFVLLFACVFPLLMEAGHGLLFTALLLMVYIGFGRASSWIVLPAIQVLRGILVLGICGLSFMFGRHLRSAEEVVEQLRMEPHSGAYNEYGWQRYGSRLLARCRQLNKPLAFALVPMPALWQEQLISEYGLLNAQPLRLHALKDAALRDMTEGLMACLPSNALVGRDSHGHWVLIAPELSHQQLLARLENRFGRPLQLEFGPQELEMFVSLQPCVLECQAEENISAVYARAIDIWGRAHRSGVAEA